MAIASAGKLCHGSFGDLTIGGRRIALLHSHDARLFRQTISGGQYDLVCYGHTHIATQERMDKTLVLNPGALYRAMPHSLAIVELDDMATTIVPL